MKNSIYTLPYVNPFLKFDIDALGNYSGVNLSKRERQIIVSIYSKGENFKKLSKTIYSVLTQELKPDKFILWLDKDKFNLLDLPYEVTKFVKNGLQIKFVKEMQGYTNTIYAFQEFYDSIVVTAKDNVYYQSNWLNKLYLSYIVSPEDIHAHITKEIRVIDDEIKNFSKIKYSNKENSSYNNFPMKIGGILYPPQCFSKEALRKDIFLKYAPNSPEIWFWIMSVLQNRKIRQVKNHNKINFVTFFKDIFEINTSYVIELENLLKFYKNNIWLKLEK